jgi:UDP-GlcNAc:undecaprenyl-phosphate/decaprenyl-phosphate GlcNAc-1-phosphate transferase
MTEYDDSDCGSTACTRSVDSGENPTNAWDMTLTISFSLSFLVTLMCMLALRPLAVAVDLVDRPGGRKTHHGAVPVVGGLAMLLGTIGSAGVAPVGVAVPPMLVSACVLLVVVGLVDDRFDLPAAVRLAFQIVVVGGLTLGSNLLVTTFGDPFGIGAFALAGVLSVAVTVIFVAGAINAFNMLDGVDGLAGAMALVALCGFGALAAVSGLPLVTYAAVLISGSVSAFLVFNLPARFNRAVRCFMGDGGSTLLGFLLACMAIAVSQGPDAVVSPVSVLWFVAMPVYEFLWTIVRRVSRGVSPFRADREHLHHLFIDKGYSVRATFLVLISLALTLLVLGSFMIVFRVSDSVQFLVFGLMGLAVVRVSYRAGDLLNRLPSTVRHAMTRPLVRPTDLG